MKKSRILALMLAAGMAVMSVPMPVYAEETEVSSQEEGLLEAALIEGKLKIKENPYIGEELSADLTGLTPSDLEADLFEYQWVRKTGEDEEGKILYEVLGKEKTFKLTDEQAGEYIGLILTPKAESGFAGELTYYFEDPVTENPNSEETAEALEESTETEETEGWMEESSQTEEESSWMEEEIGQAEEENGWNEEESSWNEEETGWNLEESTWTEEESSWNENTSETLSEDVNTEEESTWEQTGSNEEAGFEIYNSEEEVFGGEDPAPQQEPEPEVTPEEKEPTIHFETEAYDFGSWEEEGLADLTATVKFFNDSTEEITLDSIRFLTEEEEEGSAFTLIPAEEIYTVQPEGSVDLILAPAAELEPGLYQEKAVITTTAEEKAELKVSLEVLETEKNTLLSIVEPEDIAPLPNGTPKTAEDLKLPEEVMLITTWENMEAPVEWDLEDCIYDPENLNEQIFTVSGEVAIPEDVMNPDALSTYVTVTATVEAYVPEGPVLRMKPSDYDFGTLEAKAVSEAKAVFKVINEGVKTESIDAPIFYSDNGGEGVAFKAVVHNNTAEAGEKMKFTVQLKENLKPGYYSEYAIIPNTAGDDLVINLSCEIAAPAENVLIRILKPENITGLPHGSPKTAQGLGLPKSVAIETTEGRNTAAVNWKIDACGYDPNSSREQKFDVNGQVVLPEGVVNAGDVSLNLTVQVSVKGVDAYVAKAENNEVRILSQNTESAQTTIRFCAVGDGMQIKAPNNGDTRFRPKNWTVQVTKEFVNGFEEEFGLAQPGDYTLSVVFAEQRYDGSSWVDTGRTDTKSRSLHVASRVTETPTATPTPGVTKNPAVNTGDDTIILPFIAAGAAALIVLVIVIILLLKKRN